nr:hypothetical protein [Tanacetum cinerariifolium]
MMNELIRNQSKVTNHQVNVQFLLQLQPECQRFVTLVKQSQELKTVSYYKLYDILKQHQHEVNKIRAEKIACVANPLALVAQQQQVYHPQTHPTQYTQNSSARSQQAAAINRGKVIVNSPQPIYDQEPSMVNDDDDETSKDKEIDKLMALISLSFKKIYKPTNNNLQTSSNTSRANQDNSSRIHKNDGYEHQRLGNVVGARETVEQADWKDDTDDESDDQELEACYMYMAKIQEVSPDAVDSGPIFDTEPEQKVQNDDHYDVFECQHPEQSESVHKTYLIEQDAHNVIIESVDMHYDSEQIDQNDEDADLAKECELLASLIKKLKCEIDESKNQMKNKLSAHQDNISILKQQKDAQIKLYKYHEDKEIEKVIDLENKVKKAKQANPHLYDIGCYNDNLALMLSLESDEVIRLEKESRSKLSNLIRPFDYVKLNTLYDLFVPQREKSSEQRYFSERSRISHINVQNEKKKEAFKKQTTFLEKRMDESIPRLNEEMVVDLRYFNSLELEVDSLTSQLETQKTQFLNEIDRLSREYYYADHMNAMLSVFTELDEVTNLQCDYLELLQKCECLETELSKRKMMSKSFESVQKHAINLELELQQCKAKIKNDMSFKVNKSKDFCKEREQYFEIQDLNAQLQDKGIVISELKKLIEKLKGKSVDTKPQFKSNPQRDRVMHNNSQGKKKEVEDHRRSVKLSKNKTSVTACNDSLNAKTLNVTFVSAMCDKCVLIDKHDMCVLKYVAKPLKEIVASESNKKPRNLTRKLYERVSKTCSWWYPKFTPSGYIWK